jgi:hypothetical protein
MGLTVIERMYLYYKEEEAAGRTPDFTGKFFLFEPDRSAEEIVETVRKQVRKQRQKKEHK